MAEKPFTLSEAERLQLLWLIGLPQVEHAMAVVKTGSPDVLARLIARLVLTNVDTGMVSSLSWREVPGWALERLANGLPPTNDPAIPEKARKIVKRSPWRRGAKAGRKSPQDARRHVQSPETRQKIAAAARRQAKARRRAPGGTFAPVAGSREVGTYVRPAAE